MTRKNEVEVMESPGPIATHSARPVVMLLHFGGAAIRGSEVCLIQTVTALTAAGHKVLLAANNPDVVAPFISVPDESIRKTEFPAVWLEQPSWKAPFQYFASLLRLLRWGRGQRASIVLASGGLPCQIGLPLARLLGVPVVCHYFHPANRRYYYFWLVKWVDRIIVPSIVTAQSVKRGCGRDSDVIPCGVAVADFGSTERDRSWRDRLGIPVSRVIAVQVGALVPHKRPETLVQAVAILRRSGIDVGAVLVGEGMLRDSLEQLIDELGVRGIVTMTGRVSTVAPYLQHVADLHVLCSSEEGFGIAVIEAAAAGLANVVSAKTAMEEIVRDGVDGLHADGGDPASVAEAIRRLALDPTMRETFGREGRARAEARFSEAAYSQQVVALLDTTIRRGPRKSD